MRFLVRRCLLPVAFLLIAATALAIRDPRGPGRPTPPAERPTAAEPSDAAPDLSSYRLLTVRDLETSEELGKDYQRSLTVELADRLAAVVGAAEGLRLEVRRGRPLGVPGELVLSGTVVRANKGNRAARYFIGPLARARLVTDLTLSDGFTGETLAEGQVRKLWAWPGWAGVARGLGGLEKATCDVVVDYLREARPEASRPEVVARKLP